MHNYIYVWKWSTRKYFWRIRIKDLIPSYGKNIVFGYVRKCWIELQFDENKMFPDDLILIIHKYY